MKITPEIVDSVICKHVGLLPEMLYWESQRQRIVEGRKISIVMRMAILKQNDTKACGSFGKHRTMGYSSITTFLNLYETDKIFQHLVNQILSELEINKVDFLIKVKKVFKKKDIL
ncbi:MAG: hypothetical protein M0P47_09425 [Bacteroidales bacterium]|nr:hypothetical protein [Bacteroidales bacterium]